MTKYWMCMFKEETGEILRTLDGLLPAMLELYALQNLSKGYDAIIFSDEDGMVYAYITYDQEDIGVDKNGDCNIEDFCPGLLDELRRLNP